MNATALLRDQHGRLRRLVDAIDRSPEQRTDLVHDLVEALLSHLSVEDRFLGTMAERRAVAPGSHRDDHARVRNAMLQAVFAESDEEVFGQRLSELRAALRNHASSVEGDVLPRVERHVRADELERIGERMQAGGGGRDARAHGTSDAHGHAAE